MSPLLKVSRKKVEKVIVCKNQKTKQNKNAIVGEESRSKNQSRLIILSNGICLTPLVVNKEYQNFQLSGSSLTVVPI